MSAREGLCEFAYVIVRENSFFSGYLDFVSGCDLYSLKSVFTVQNSHEFPFIAMVRDFPHSIVPLNVILSARENLSCFFLINSIYGFRSVCLSNRIMSPFLRLLSPMKSHHDPGDHETTPRSHSLSYSAGTSLLLCERYEEYTDRH